MCIRDRYNGAASEIKYNFAGVFVAKIDKTALELTNGKEEISSKPVSYTHLDVYKRQHLCLAGRGPNSNALDPPLAAVVAVAPNSCLLYTSRCV